MIDGGANTEAADISGWTMLIHAALFEDPTLVKVCHRVWRRRARRAFFVDATRQRRTDRGGGHQWTNRSVLRSAIRKSEDRRGETLDLIRPV